MPSPLTTPAIPFDAFTLAAIAAEIRALLPARVQKVQQPTANEVILSLFGAGAWRLLFCADPKFFRVHPTQQRRENPVTPPGFCQVCRKYLDGAVLTGLVLPRFDRVLHLEFRGREGETIWLIVELMGRNSNVVLATGAEAEGSIVRGALRPPPADAARTLRPGSRYAAPPVPTETRDSWTVTEAGDAIFDDLPAASDAAAQVTFLTQTFSGIGRFAAGEIIALANTQSGGDVATAFVERMADARDGRFAPHSIGDAEGHTVGVTAYLPLTVSPGLRFLRESMTVALDTFYATLAQEGAETTERQTLEKALAREIAYRERDLRSQRETIAEAARADIHERAGNNLLAHLSRAKRGDAHVTVPDLYADDGGADATVTLTLDSKRSPQENADAYFERARKARDAADYAEGRAADREAELEELYALRDRIAADAREDSLQAFRATLEEIVGAERVQAAQTGAKSGKPSAGANAKSAAERPFGGHRIRRFTVDGYELLIGETGEANDYLTTRVASPTDLWMHVRSAPGAHGILRTNGQPMRVPESIIRRAAAGVAARSGTSIKHAGVVAVDVVEKRYVRKPRGAKAGMVRYERERVLDVVPEAL